MEIKKTMSKVYKVAIMVHQHIQDVKADQKFDHVILIAMSFVLGGSLLLLFNGAFASTGVIGQWFSHTISNFFPAAGEVR